MFKHKKQLTHLSFFVLTGIIFFSVTYIGIKNIFRYNSFKSEFQRLQNELETEKQIQKTNFYLQNAIKSPDYWELQAKQQLHFARPEEIIYFFGDSQ